MIVWSAHQSGKPSSSPLSYFSTLFSQSCLCLGKAKPVLTLLLLFCFILFWRGVEVVVSHRSPPFSSDDEWYRFTLMSWTNRSSLGYISHLLPVSLPVWELVVGCMCDLSRTAVIFSRIIARRWKGMTNNNGVIIVGQSTSSRQQQSKIALWSVNISYSPIYQAGQSEFFCFYTSILLVFKYFQL